MTAIASFNDERRTYSASSSGRTAKQVAARAWMAVALALVGAIGAYLVSHRQAKVYEATAQVHLNDINQISALASSGSAGTTTSAGIELNRLTGPDVASAVARKLGVPVAPALDVSQSAINPQVATLTTTGPSATLAADGANAYVNAYVGQSQQASADQLATAITQVTTKVTQLTYVLGQLQGQAATAVAALAAGKPPTSPPPSVPAPLASQIGSAQTQQQFFQSKLSQLQFLEELGQSSDASVIAAALPSTTPVSPKTSRDVLLGTAAGFLVGLALALVLVGRDDRLNDLSSISDAAPDLPILAAVPGNSRFPPHRRRAAQAEAYRVLRAAVSFGGARSVSSLQVVGVGPAVKHARVALDLAIAQARAGRQTTLLCADVRSPVLPKALGLSGEPGLTTILQSDQATPGVRIAIEHEPGLTFVGPGPIDATSPDLLAGANARSWVGALKPAGGVMIVNAAAVPEANDAAMLATMVDANIIVVDVGRTRAPDLRAAVALMAQVDAPVLGLVVYGVSAPHALGRAADVHRHQNGASHQPVSEKDWSLSSDPSFEPEISLDQT